MFSNTITIIMQEMGVVIGYPVLRAEFIKKKTEWENHDKAKARL